MLIYHCFYLTCFYVTQMRSRIYPDIIYIQYIMSLIDQCNIGIVMWTSFCPNCLVPQYGWRDVRWGCSQSCQLLPIPMVSVEENVLRRPPAPPPPPPPRNIVRNNWVTRYRWYFYVVILPWNVICLWMIIQLFLTWMFCCLSKHISATRPILSLCETSNGVRLSLNNLHENDWISECLYIFLWPIWHPTLPYNMFGIDVMCQKKKPYWHFILKEINEPIFYRIHIFIHVIYM